MIHNCPHCKEPLPDRLIKQIRKRSKKRVMGMAAAKRKQHLTLENARRLIAKTNAAKRVSVGGGLVWKQHSEKAAGKGGKGCRCMECQIKRGWTQKEIEQWAELELEIRKRRQHEKDLVEKKRLEKLEARNLRIAGKEMEKMECARAREEERVARENRMRMRLALRGELRQRDV